MNNEVRIPDIEVIVGSAGNDVAVFAFYKREDIHQGYEVVCALSAPRASHIIRQVLQDAITTLNTANWHTVDELHPDVVSGEDEAPF